jgi:hypothetical protein
MKSTLCCLTLVLTIASSCSSLGEVKEDQQRPPNILLIAIDDLATHKELLSKLTLQFEREYEREHNEKQGSK